MSCRTLRDQPEVNAPKCGKMNVPVSLIGVRVSPESQKKAETILDDDPSVRWFRYIVTSDTQTPHTPIIVEVAKA